ncbi:polysaccharide deacetylase family protein [Catenulispora sp. NL8]|uniref:Polysaccharide deacetylase family protein n=1 Tax=Catenulispora pinistramenti TaxID=2705254 RepID=A0ABS5KYA3_9ACTN|nr:polysaccharide deacetylase family protein [Catenulispora pinistramenti]MBS2551037.1 polysaccharide deacetylase family protein [Catenulispora pinistramenti]
MPPRPQLLVSIHDIAPASAAATERWLADLDARDIPATLLVIPGPWRGSRLSQSPDLVATLHAAAARGHELALHGWAHRAGPDGAPWRRAAAQLLARGAAEFAALDVAEATARLSAGLAELAALDIEPVGFHPPGWLASPGAFTALRRVGLRYTSSHLFVHDLITERRHTLPALSHRPGGAGELFAARLMRKSASAMARNGHSFRVALHPDDLRQPALRATTLAVIDAALAAGYRAGTYSGLVMRGAAVPIP